MEGMSLVGLDQEGKKMFWIADHRQFLIQTISEDSFFLLLLRIPSGWAWKALTAQAFFFYFSVMLVAYKFVDLHTQTFQSKIIWQL